MSESIAAAEKAAMEGRGASPDTQDLHELFKELSGESFVGPKVRTPLSPCKLSTTGMALTPP